MPEKIMTKDKWEQAHPNSQYINRKALYANAEYLKILREDGYKKAKEYRTNNPLKTISGYVAGMHRSRRNRIFNEIKLNNRQRPPNNPDAEQLHESLADLPEPEAQLSEYGLDMFSKDVVMQDPSVQKIDTVRDELYLLCRYIMDINSTDSLSKKDKLSRVSTLSDVATTNINKLLQDNGGHNNTIPEVLVKAAISVAYKDIGYTKAGGREYEQSTPIPDGVTRQPNYHEMLVGVDKMKKAAALVYHRKVTGDPNAQIPHGREFDKLVKKWGNLKQAAYYSLIYGLPAVGIIGAGILTGSTSLWVHALASAAGAATGLGTSAIIDSRSKESGSYLKDINNLAGLKELNWRTNEDGYLAPPKYNTVHSALRSLFNHSPQVNVRHNNISRGDLKYILERGESNSVKWQKRTRLTIALLTALGAGYMHKDAILNLPDQINSPTTTGVSTFTSPSSLAPIDDVVTAQRSWWQHFSSSDGTGPKLTAPQIPNCYVPKGLHTN